jgi:hypothetical protein
MTRQIKRFIDVEITKGTSRVSAAGFNVLMAITNSDLISTSRRIKSFTTYASVALFFGSSSEEAKAANAFYFQNAFQTDQPDELQFGRYVDASIAALIECGTEPELDFEVWKLVSDGEFAVTIDGVLNEETGLDFTSVTSLDDVASVIDTALGAAGDCYYLDGRFNIKSGTVGAASTITLLSTVAAPAGTDISGAAYLDGDTLYGPANLTGSILSQGQILETPEEALTAIEAINDDWYAMSGILAMRDIPATDAFATAIESRRKMFLIATNDVTVLTLGATSSFSYYCKNLNYKRSASIYSATAAEYPDFSWLGQQLPKDVGSTNWAFKELAGTADGAVVDITPDNLTEAQIDAALDVNCNVYTPTLGSNFVYLGTMNGGRNADKEGEYIDIIRNIDFLQARTEEGLISLLLEREIIPMTDAGITMTEARLQEMLETYGVVQGILIGGSVLTSFPKRSDISQTDRDDRLLPDGTFTADLQGAINKVVVRGTVSI